ncbi:hypothetical protein [Salinimicrobium soli]|uniref:hypothetical protein n=1 Tax=Salinimicrobium soli TaxID=1254399 RepID=UPI003AAC744D
MKTLVMYVVLLFWAGVSQAQEIEELKEAKVGFAPLSSEVVRDGDSYSFKVNETYQGQFEKDPIAFMETYFDIGNFISSVKGEEYDSYLVTLRSKKGNLKADFDKEGNLVRTSERFKDILLPEELRDQLLKDHEGWTMVKNVHVSTARDGIVNKDLYRIKLEKGDQRKNVKIDMTAAEGSIVVSN